MGVASARVGMAEASQRGHGGSSARASSRAGEAEGANDGVWGDEMASHLAMVTEALRAKASALDTIVNKLEEANMQIGYERSARLQAEASVEEAGFLTQQVESLLKEKGAIAQDKLRLKREIEFFMQERELLALSIGIDLDGRFFSPCKAGTSPPSRSSAPATPGTYEDFAAAAAERFGREIARRREAEEGRRAAEEALAAAEEKLASQAEELARLRGSLGTPEYEVFQTPLGFTSDDDLISTGGRTPPTPLGFHGAGSDGGYGRSTDDLSGLAGDVAGGTDLDMSMGSEACGGEAGTPGSSSRGEGAAGGAGGARRGTGRSSSGEWSREAAPQAGVEDVAEEARAGGRPAAAMAAEEAEGGAGGNEEESPAKGLVRSSSGQQSLGGGSVDEAVVAEAAGVADDIASPTGAAGGAGEEEGLSVLGVQASAWPGLPTPTTPPGYRGGEARLGSPASAGAAERGEAEGKQKGGKGGRSGRGGYTTPPGGGREAGGGGGGSAGRPPRSAARRERGARAGARGAKPAGGGGGGRGRVAAPGPDLLAELERGTPTAPSAPGEALDDVDIDSYFRSTPIGKACAEGP